MHEKTEIELSTYLHDSAPRLLNCRRGTYAERLHQLLAATKHELSKDSRIVSKDSSNFCQQFFYFAAPSNVGT